MPGRKSREREREWKKEWGVSESQQVATKWWQERDELLMVSESAVWVKYILDRERGRKQEEIVGEYRDEREREGEREA